jgi:hypothetical protein
MGASLFPVPGILSVSIDALLALTTALYLLKLLVVDLVGVKGIGARQLLGATMMGVDGFAPGSVLCGAGEKRSLLHQNVRRKAW